MMAQWHVKEMSDLTKISVRMLHHYDKIGLLKPSMRASNGYRWYSEQDLAKLQQIIALKFFGFSLSTIKTMLQQKLSVQEHLSTQQKMLCEQAEELKQALDALAIVLQQCQTSKSLNWNDLITLIERYRMAAEIKKTWVGKLSEKQQDNYLSFKLAYPKETNAWDKAIEQMNNGQLGDAEGPEGQRIYKVFLELRRVQVKYDEAIKNKAKMMTKEDASELLQFIDKALREGIPLNKEGTLWFAKAQIAYSLNCWKNLYEEIQKNLEADPEGAAGKKLATQWRKIIEDNCWGSNDFFLGFKLLMESAKAKAELKSQRETSAFSPEVVQEMANDIKMLRDPMATNWILKALEVH